MRRETGQTSAEYVGVLVVVVVVITAVVASSSQVGATLTAGLRSAYCRVGGGTACPVDVAGGPGADGDPQGPGDPDGDGGSGGAGGSGGEGEGGGPGGGGPAGGPAREGRDADGSVDEDLVEGTVDPPGDGAPDDRSTGPGTGPDADGVDPTGEQSDPVNSYTGAFVSSATDLALPGLSPAFVLARSYSSDDDHEGPLGRGWTHAYAARLEVDGERVVLVTEGGRRYGWTRDGETFGADAGVRSELRAADGGYELRRRGGAVLAFDGRGRLLRMTEPTGTALTLRYDGDRLVGVTDPTGREAVFTYDGDRLVEVRVPDGRAVRYAYRGGLLARVTGPAGDEVAYRYDRAGRLAELRDADGRVVVANRYDRRGRVVEQTDGLGGRTRFVTDEVRGTLTATMFDARGSAWTDVYREGALVRRIDPYGSTVTYRYDEQLQVVSVTDADGGVTRLDHDARGNLLAVTPPGAGEPTDRFRYDARDRPIEHVDALGRRVTMTYDAAGNLLRVDAPQDSTTRLAYDGPPGRPTAVTDAEGRTTRLGYDDAGRLVSATTPGGATTQRRYDDAGNLVAVVDPRGTAPGADRDEFTTRFAHDPAGRVTEVVDPLGAATRLRYDGGQLVEQVDAAGRGTRYEHDVMGRLTVVVAADGTRTRYAYDPAGNLVARTAANGAVTRYGYDGANRLAQVMTPEGRRWSYEWDRSGALAAVVDPRTVDGRPARIELDHDERGRTTRIDFADATPDVGLTYDAAGRVTAMTDGLGTETYTWDDLDRLVEVARGRPTFSYAYDRSSRLVERTVPGTGTTRYAYDADGRLAELTSGPVRAAYRYDPAGLLQEAVQGNGTVTRTEHDAAGRVASIVTGGPVGPVAAVAYERDALGNPVVERRGGETTRYRYDELDRLTQAVRTAAGGGTERQSWAYDEAGRRLREQGPEGVTTYRYDLDDRLLATAGPDGTADYRYDEAGNLLADGARTYTYDLSRRVTSVTTGDATVAYGYDGRGTLTSAQSADGVTSYRWDPNAPLPRLATEDRPDGTRQSHVLDLGLGTVATRQGGAVGYLHTDALRSTMAVSGPAGDLSRSFAYTPFGETSAAEELTPDTPDPSLRFTGEHQDPTTGQYDLRLRRYNPDLGQFHQVDPAAHPTTLPYTSTYAYAFNNPTTYTDPTGACPWCATILGGAALGAGINAIAYLGSQVMTGEEPTWGGFAGAVTEGALIGAAIGSFGVFGAGAVTVAQGAGIAAASNAVGQVVEWGIDREPWNPGEGITKIVTAGALGAFGTWVGNTARVPVVIGGREVAPGMSERAVVGVESYIGVTRGTVAGALTNALFDETSPVTSGTIK